MSDGWLIDVTLFPLTCPGTYIVPQKSMRKDYSEKLLFIKDQFYEKLLTVRQCLVYSMDVLIVAEFDFKSFSDYKSNLVMR